MLLDTTDINFWIVGIVWFTVPILSWLWSLLTLRLYVKTSASTKDMRDSLATLRKTLDDIVAHRKESEYIREKAKEEIAQACVYYEKIKQLLESK